MPTPVPSSFLHLLLPFPRLSVAIYRFSHTLLFLCFPFSFGRVKRKSEIFLVPVSLLRVGKTKIEWKIPRKMRVCFFVDAKSILSLYYALKHVCIESIHTKGLFTRPDLSPPVSIRVWDPSGRQLGSWQLLDEVVDWKRKTCVWGFKHVWQVLPLKRNWGVKGGSQGFGQFFLIFIQINYSFHFFTQNLFILYVMKI